MSGRDGMSVVELVVVLAVMAVLLVLLVPAVQQARAAAQRMECMNNLRQIALAAQQFASMYDERLPTVDGGQQSASPNLSVHAAILPYIEQGVIYAQVQTSQSLPPVKAFLSPAD